MTVSGDALAVESAGHERIVVRRVGEDAKLRAAEAVCGRAVACEISTILRPPQECDSRHVDAGLSSRRHSRTEQTRCVVDRSCGQTLDQPYGHQPVHPRVHQGLSSRRSGRPAQPRRRFVQRLGDGQDETVGLPVRRQCGADRRDGQPADWQSGCRSGPRRARAGVPLSLEGGPKRIVMAISSQGLPRVPVDAAARD